ncbi:MAG: ADOP family duplicated permease, partial [Gemmatimonadaceae bacterium]
RKDEPTGNFAYARYVDFARDSRSFDVVAAVAFRDRAVGVGEDVREMPIAAVSASFWKLFDAPPVVGRVFSIREDTLPVGTPVAVLGYSYWQNRYGGKRDVLGAQLMIGSVSYTIVGVAPQGFAGLEAGKVPVAFIPITHFAAQADFLASGRSFATTYSWSWLEVVVRRKPNVTVATADADLSNAFRRSYDAERAVEKSLTPPEIARPHARVTSIHSERGPNATPVAAVATWITGVALVVLLIACANVANLLLARAMQRRREIALRLALGVTRARLLSQLLSESLLLAVLGGAAGVAIAQWGGAALHALFIQEGEAPSSVTDVRTLLFAGVAAIITGIITGLVPALQAGKDDLATTLKAGVREGTYRKSRARAFLLLAQGALSVVLLVGAGLFVRSLDNVRALRLGYDVDPVLYVSPNLRGAKLSKPELAVLGRRLRDEAAALPGVARVSRAASVPFWNTWTSDLKTPGVDSVNKLGHFTLQAGDPSFFETIGTRVLRGRGIATTDIATSQPVMLISEGMAKKIWPNEDAIGKCMQVGADTVPCSMIVGITEDIRQNALNDPSESQYYFPVEQFHPEITELFVRAASDPTALSTLLRRRLQPLMPGTGYVTVVPLRDIVDPNQRSWKLGATMFSAFGLLSLLLAAIGLYSVIAYDVAQRSHELGVRIALGAQPSHLVRLVVAEGVRFAAIGLVIGGIIALAAGRWVEPLLFAQSARDPVVFGVVTATLLIVAIAACFIPAARAARVDPNSSLRTE